MGSSAKTRSGLISSVYRPSDTTRTIDSGVAWQLEGHVGRIAMAALQDGAAVLPAERHSDYYGSVVPSYTDVTDEPGSTGSVANSEAYEEE